MVGQTRCEIKSTTLLERSQIRRGRETISAARSECALRRAVWLSSAWSGVFRRLAKPSECSRPVLTGTSCSTRLLLYGRLRQLSSSRCVARAPPSGSKQLRSAGTARGRAQVLLLPPQPELGLLGRGRTPDYCFDVRRSPRDHSPSSVTASAA